MIYSIYDNASIVIAKELILKGKIIIYPTDTIYGFGVDATNCNAIDLLNKVKKRTQVYSIIVNSIEMIKTYANLTDKEEKKLKKYLPGPYTIILKKNNNNLSKLISLDLSTIGIRMPKHNFCLDLVNEIKHPIVTTSVNEHGSIPLNNINVISKIFPHIDIFEDNKMKNMSKGSTIVDFAKYPNQIVRHGDGIYIS